LKNEAEFTWGGRSAMLLWEYQKVLIFTTDDESTYDRDPVSAIHHCWGCRDWGYFDASNGGQGTHHHILELMPYRHWNDAVIGAVLGTTRLQIMPEVQDVQLAPAAMLHPIIKLWPFCVWALDFIGQIHPASSKRHQFVLVAMDYFTKWMEAIPLKNMTHREVIHFISEHIIHRFGIP
jgi:hypothetical protein